MIKKRDIITLSTLSGILVALILIFALLVAPLLFDDKNNRVPPEVWEGEYTNGATLSLYKPISTENLLEVTVKNSTGEYTFLQKTNDDGKMAMVIKGHERVVYDASIYAYLSVFAKEPLVPIDGTVIRNLTQAEMAEYGTTELLCQAQVTVKFKENNEKGEYTLFIGNRIMSANDSYYVAMKGRDHVYCVSALSIDNAILKGINDYIVPVIFTKYKNANEAGLAIQQFLIMKANQKGESFGEIIMLEQSTQVVGSETSSSYKFTFPDVFPQKITASNDYVLGVFNTLYVSFAGDRVVAIDPDEKEREKYGLGENQEQYFVYATVKDESEKNYVPAYYISKEIIDENGEGHYYVMSGYYAEYTIVEVPSSQLYFLKEDDQTMIDWAATNSVFAGFSEYLRPEPSVNAPGVKVMRIRTRDYNETFTLTINKNGQLTVTSESGKYTFIDDLSATVEFTTNQFSNLYTLLLYFPMPSRYTSIKGEELSKVMVDENIIYQLEVEMNDGRLCKYTYYTLDDGYAGYALCESKEGHIDENGEKKYTETQIVFDVKSRQIGKIAEAYKIILEGGKIDPRDYIY